MLGTSNPKKRLHVRPDVSRDLAVVADAAGNVLAQAAVPPVVLCDRVSVDVPRPQCGAGAIAHNLQRHSRRRVRAGPDPAEEVLVVRQHDNLTCARIAVALLEPSSESGDRRGLRSDHRRRPPRLRGRGLDPMTRRRRQEPEYSDRRSSTYCGTRAHRPVDCRPLRARVVR